MKARTKSSKKAALAAGNTAKTVEDVQSEASLEHVVWTLRSALFQIDEVICDDGDEETREHHARATEALIKTAIAELEGGAA